MPWTPNICWPNYCPDTTKTRRSNYLLRENLALALSCMRAKVEIVFGQSALNKLAGCDDSPFDPGHLLNCPDQVLGADVIPHVVVDRLSVGIRPRLPKWTI